MLSLLLQSMSGQSCSVPPVPASWFSGVLFRIYIVLPDFKHTENLDILPKFGSDKGGKSSSVCLSAKGRNPSLGEMAQSSSPEQRARGDNDHVPYLI